MSNAESGVGAFDAGLEVGEGGAVDVEWRRAELLASLEGAQRKVDKQQAFLDAAFLEVERLEAELRALGEVGSDGVVGE